MKIWLSGLLLLTAACAEREFSGSGATPTSKAPQKEHSEKQEGNAKPAEIVAEAATPEAAPAPAPAPEPLPKEIEESTVTQPLPGSEAVLEGTRDKVIEFGSNEVFRIGNGKANQSSCLSTIDSYDLSGTIYYFDFEVKNDKTSVELAIGRLCGLDFNSNYISMLKDGKIVQKAQRMPRVVVGDKGKTYEPYPVLTLDKGIYSLQVESAFHQELGDNDDFIVGKITIKADKDIKAVGVRTK